jgi:hypothetical protein
VGLLRLTTSASLLDEEADLCHAGHPFLARWEVKHRADDSALARGSNVLNSSLLDEDASC